MAMVIPKMIMKLPRVTALHECHRHEEVSERPPSRWSPKKP